MRTYITALVLVAAVASARENPETLVERSQARARAVLDKAVEAIGGADALRSVDVVRLRLQGQTWPRLQMSTPEPPYEPGSLDETILLDLKGNRLVLEQRGTGAGFENHNRIVLRPGEGANYDLRAKTKTAIPAAQTTQQQFIQYQRRLPNLILRQALDRVLSLRHLGQDQFDGRLHDVITFVMPDTQQVALYVDAKSGLISKYELMLNDALAGDDVSEIRFSDYAKVGALQVPRKWSWRVANEQQADYTTVVEFNPTLAATAFDFADSGFTSVQPAPQNLEANVEKLADGVYVLHNVAGQNQNTLAVEFKDYIVAVEAPGTSDGAENVIKRIKETIPGKPIRYVAMTHHHGDHIGGLRAFIAEGATVITTKGNRGAVETMVASKQNDRLGRSPRAAQFAFLENGKRVITDGERTIELHDIGPNPHAREMVVAYLPSQRVVFQGDLFALPNNDAPFGPPQASTLSFAQRLKEKGFDVEWIASVHGRTARIADLVRATSGG